MTRLFASPFLIFLPRAFVLLTMSRAKASWRMFTRGPFPREKRYGDYRLYRYIFVAMLSPTRVFPAPGTPVTKQIAFCARALSLNDLRDRIGRLTEVIHWHRFGICRPRNGFDKARARLP